ncbi:MFS transporter [Pseudonocardia sp. CA-107938]|uniref:MFS transporter n=1 Tax=Pseudonocardia sp. CA-107938 TaxID=3240021 RepID=UPI003D8E484C
MSGSTVMTPTFRDHRRVAIAGGIGTMLEMYDFLLFGTAAALIFDGLFFPTFDPSVGVLLAFATFGAGVLIRPIGGAFIAHFGDRLGRKRMLVLTLSVTGAATVLIGLLPGYATIGVWAPILLTVLRLVQGFFVGGEQPGAFVLVSEHVPDERRGWYGGFVSLGAPAGLLLGTAAFTLSSVLTGDAFLSWGWRIPFLASVVLIGVALYIRLRLAESPAFVDVQRQSAEARIPIVEAFRTAWRRIVLGCLVGLGAAAGVYVVNTFAINYMTASLGIARNLVLSALLVGTVFMIVGVLAGARLSDRIGRYRVILAGNLLTILWVFPFFWLLETRSVPLSFVAMAVALGVQGVMYGPIAAYFSELFDSARVRYSGVAVSYGLATLLGGGLSPAIAGSLFAGSGGSWYPVAAYVIGVLIVSVVALAVGGEPSRVSPVPSHAGS